MIFARLEDSGLVLLLFLSYYLSFSYFSILIPLYSFFILDIVKEQ